jgi:hypothetical protein
MWPTWADVVSQEMPNAEFFNLGKSGAGNLLISSRIAEANNRFKFTDTDLVMVMFSTYCREDRWVDQGLHPFNGWVSCGNIYNNDIYPKDWVKKFADEKGYMIRDASLIDMSTKYLEALPCTSVSMLSVPFKIGADSCDSGLKNPESILSVYNDTFNKFKPSMYESVLRGWKTNYKFSDGHPSTAKYFNYLENIGFKLSVTTKEYADNATRILQESESRDILSFMFPAQNDSLAKANKLMF